MRVSRRDRERQKSRRVGSAGAVRGRPVRLRGGESEIGWRWVLEVLSPFVAALTQPPFLARTFAGYGHWILGQGLLTLPGSAVGGRFTPASSDPLLRPSSAR